MTSTLKWARICPPWRGSLQANKFGIHLEVVLCFLGVAILKEKNGYKKSKSRMPK